jgi:hypothetical protein
MFTDVLRERLMGQKANEIIYGNFTKHRATVEKWLSYPRQLQMEYGINPILAGGCMRDIILGGEVSDLDVFVTRSSYQNGLSDFDFLIANMAEKEGWELDHNKGASETRAPLHSVWTFQSEFQDKPYNIIILFDDIGQKDIIKDFNFGINMISINTYSILAAHPHFVEDVEGLKCTLRNERSRERTMYKYEKLCLQYELPLVTVEGLELGKPNAGLILPPGVS